MSNRQLLYRANIPVRWGDMDNYGHVNNTVYLEYVQEARIEWFAQIGVDINHDSLGPVVLQTLHTYLAPVVHPATLVVELFAGELGRSSLVVEHRLSVLGDEIKLYGEGYCKLVWVDHHTNKSVPVPHDVRQTLENKKPA